MLGGDDTYFAKHLWCKAPSRTKHGEPRVDQLRVPKPLLGDDPARCLWVVDAERIETVVSLKGTVEVAKGLLRRHVHIGVVALLVSRFHYGIRFRFRCWCGNMAP